MGSIPTTWDTRRISALYDARNTKVSDKDYPPLSVTMQGIVPQLETAAKTQDGDNRKLVLTGDFVINSRSDRRGACGISPYDGSVTLISNVLAPKHLDRMDVAYFSYLFKTEGFADEFYKQGTGIVDDLWSTNWTRMKRIEVCIPPLVEQRAIASYLDSRLADINALIEETERVVGQLEELRKSVISEAVTRGLDTNVSMRYTGDQWIRQVPDDWNTPPLKVLLEDIGSGTSVDGANWPAAYGEPGVLTLSAVYQSKLTLEANKAVTGDAVTRLSCPLVLDSLIISRCNTSEWVGTAAYVDEVVPNLFLPDKLWQLQFQDSLTARWVYYYLRSAPARIYFASMSVGASQTMQNIAKDDLLNIRIALPPQNARRMIIDVLETKTNFIDALVNEKQVLINHLHEYRKSLISEAVTGKFKVPGV